MTERRARLYSSEEDAALRAAWPDVAGVAATLGRTVIAVKARARKLGLPCPSGRPKRPYTDAERQVVIDRYPVEGAKPIARELGRSRADIVEIAGRLGVHHQRRWTKEEDARFAQMRREGENSTDIGVALNRSKRAVSRRAETLGITTPLYDPEARRRSLVTLREATDNIVEARWARRRLALGEHGWPPDLTPKEVSILESLRLRGPQTRIVLSESIGEPATRPRHKRLMTHGGTSSMARLLARGLVTKCCLNDGRKRITIYTLTRMAEERRGSFRTVSSLNAPIAARGRYVGPRVRRTQLEKAS